MRELESVTATTLLERRATVIANLEGTTLSFEGKHVELPEHVAEELEAIVAAEEPFTARSFPASSTRTAGSSRQTADSRRIPAA